MSEPKRILEDDRPIVMVVFPDKTEDFWEVGKGGITRIVAYAEVGNGAYVPWLAVYHGDAILQRVNAAYTEGIQYAD